MIKIRPLETHDFEMLHRWMNELHLRPYYMWGEISFSEVKAKFTPRINGEDDCNCLIAMSDNIPFGYIQWYFNRTNPDYGVATLGFLDGLSFDYFIGETSLLGKQLGSSMLCKTIEYVIPLVDEVGRQFFLIHADENKKAVRCSERAGFRSVASMNYNDLPSRVYWRKS